MAAASPLELMAIRGFWAPFPVSMTSGRDQPPRAGRVADSILALSTHVAHVTTASPLASMPTVWESDENQGSMLSRFGSDQASPADFVVATTAPSSAAQTAMASPSRLTATRTGPRMGPSLVTVRSTRGEDYAPCKGLVAHSTVSMSDQTA